MPGTPVDSPWPPLRSSRDADDILLTTDADGLVDPSWLAANLAALAEGADAVAGWVDLHPEEWAQLPMKLHEDDARECAYDTLCDEICARLDPDPADPLPRHTQHSGASIAVTAAAYARSGGVPPTASGEDRALIAALRRVDARVRHAPEVHVSVSGRTVGRSPGGMADTIRRRMIQPDRHLDDRLEPAQDCAHRARARAALRAAWRSPGADVTLQAGMLQMTPAAVRALLDAPYFGMAWEAIENAAPRWRGAFYRYLAPGEPAPDVADANAAKAMADYLRRGLAGLKAKAQAKT